MSTFSEFTTSLMVNNIISAQQLHVVGPLGSERIKILFLIKIPNKLGNNCNQMPFLLMGAESGQLSTTRAELRGAVNTFPPKQNDINLKIHGNVNR